SSSESTMATKDKRVTVCPDVNQKKIAVNSLKGLGDFQSARPNCGSEIRFRRTDTPIFAANTLPEIEDKSEGVWRKLTLLLFNARFVHNPTALHEKFLDDTLGARLKACADTVLAKLVDYYPIHRKEGVGKTQHPKILEKAKAKYRRSFNKGLDFIQHCTVPDEGATFWSADFPARFKEFCDARSYQKTDVLNKEIRDALDTASLDKKNIQIKVPGTKSNWHGWRGIKWVEEWKEKDNWSLADVAEPVQEMESPVVQEQEDVQMECEPTAQEVTAAPALEED
ncbi:hypothetical protein HDV00_002071, partial [Rhizophlyctis rosea]